MLRFDDLVRPLRIEWVRFDKITGSSPAYAALLSKIATVDTLPHFEAGKWISR